MDEREFLEKILRRGLTGFAAQVIAVCMMSRDDELREKSNVFAEALKHYGLEEDVLDHERAFFEPDGELPDRKTCSDVSWMTEMSVVLFWACGLLPDEMLYSVYELCSPLEMTVNIFMGSDLDELMSMCELKSAEEIIEAANYFDKVENEEDFDLFKDIVYERQQGFSWLFIENYEYFIVCAENRKERSEIFLRHSGVGIDPELQPFFTESDAVRSHEETLRLAVSEFMAAEQILSDTDNDEENRKNKDTFSGIAAKMGVSQRISDNRDDPAELTDEKRIELLKKIEKTMPLFWAAGVLENDDLPYPSGFFGDLYENIRNFLDSCESFDELLSKTEMHTQTLILDNADTCFRMNWACETEGVMTGNLDRNVVNAQLEGFCWLFCKRDWTL